MSKIKESETIVSLKKQELGIQMTEVTREYENVNELIKDIEERKIKCEEATIKMSTKNIEITKLMESVEVKEKTAKIVMETAKVIKEEVETSVRENLDEKAIKGMQALLNQPSDKIKLILQAVNALNPVVGQNYPDTWEGSRQLVQKAGQFYEGVKN